jgi:hypothetical protein
MDKNRTVLTGSGDVIWRCQIYEVHKEGFVRKVYLELISALFYTFCFSMKFQTSEAILVNIFVNIEVPF